MDLAIYAKSFHFFFVV